jgi:amino acid transporter, AAT family
MSTAQLPPVGGPAEPKVTQHASPPASDPVHHDPAGSRWVVFGLANLAVVLLLSVGGWYLLADPEWSPWGFYPMPFNAALFWAILFVVFIGFNAEFAGFNRLRQPWRGLAIAAGTAVFAVAVTAILAGGLGRIDPDFAPGRDGGLGYFTGALFVLFGFGTFVVAVLNWQHWPWPQLGLRQPVVGLAEIAAIVGPTMLLYFVLGLPAVSASDAEPVMALDTVMGWFYSVIVSVILTGQALDNWPWRLAGSPARVALISTVGNVVIGTALYFVARELVEVLLGADTTAALGDTINQFPAQIGVCWVFWIILWANAFGNKPTGLGAAANYATRIVLTLGLAVLTFVLYYRFAADHVLHEPAVADGISGNALGFVDWMVLMTLLYVVGFESMGLRRVIADDGGRAPAVR